MFITKMEQTLYLLTNQRVAGSVLSKKHAMRVIELDRQLFVCTERMKITPTSNSISAKEWKKLLHQNFRKGNKTKYAKHTL